MRLLLALALVILFAACGSGPISNLPLAWKGVGGAPRPSPSVANALASVPISFGLRDVRPDPTVVGMDEDSGAIVRTSDNVAMFASNRMGEMLRAAGARLDESALAVVETDLVEFRVNEGGMFNGLAAIRVTVRRAGSVDWSKAFEGRSSRWGKSHNPENYNEALSNALHEATEDLVRDEGFAAALTGAQVAPPPAEMPPAGGPPGS